MAQIGPTDQHPDEKIRHALRLIEHAYDEKSRLAEHELKQLRALNKERQGQVTALESRVADLEAQLRDANDRVSLAANERDAIRNELKAMQREVSKLDQFKRSILQSIKDDDAAPPTLTASSININNERTYCGSSAPYAFGSTHYAPAQYSPQVRSPSMGILPDAYQGGGTVSAVPSRLSATHRCGAGPVPGIMYGDSAVPSSIMPNAAEPPPASAAHIDGKDFFKAARLRLTYEQFNTFLINIRSLNDRLQTQEETLAQVSISFNQVTQQQSHCRALHLYYISQASCLLNFTQRYSHHGRRLRRFSAKIMKTCFSSLRNFWSSTG